jgi:hypothetical protein
VFLVEARHKNRAKDRGIPFASCNLKIRKAAEHAAVHLQKRHIDNGTLKQ